MKGHIGLFLLGVGAAAAGAFVYDKVRSGQIDTAELGERMEEVSHQLAREAGEMKDKVVDFASAAMAGMLDINEASRDDLRRLGIHDDATLDRLVEGRPYRNKMDLLTRMIVPEDVYNLIKAQICINHADESVKVA